MPRIVDTPQTIVRLEASNIKRLKAVRITPDGNLVIIGGRNEQGKSSVLDCIKMGFRGKRATPGRPVRDGQKGGNVELETEDLVIRRTFTPAGGGQLTVTRKPGVVVKKPQTGLDQLIGDLTFDPEEFTRLDRKAQAEQLRALSGLDTLEIDAKRQAAYDERTDVNRELKAAQARLDAMPVYPDAPVEEISAAELMKEMEQAEDCNRDNEIERKNLEDLRKRYDDTAAEYADVEKQIQDLKERHRILRDKMTEFNAMGKDLARTVDSLQDVDTAAIKARMVELSDINDQVKANRARNQLEMEIGQLNTKSTELTVAIKDCDKARADAIAAAKMPIEGLALDVDGFVTYKGIPFDQCSQAEQIRVSVAMGFACNPDLRVLLIRTGSLLDKDNLKLVAELAEQNDGQVWIERVADGDEGAVIIEDGEVRDGPAAE